MEIYPSIISADLLNLEKTICLIDDYVDGYHIDIMDDHFVPNLTWGPSFVSALRKITKRPFEIHLMVDNPEKWISRVDHSKQDSFVFHAEAVNHEKIRGLIKDVSAAGWRVGIALNPSTAVDILHEYVSTVDLILLMSVNPGFSGQSFIDTTEKIIHLDQMSKSLGIKTPFIAMDGGINLKNIATLKQKGVARVGVAGAIFFDGDMIKNISDLRQATKHL